MDNTLCDTFHTLSKPQWERVAKAFEKKGKPQYAKALRKNFGKFGFVYTLAQLGLNKQEKHFAVREYDKVSVKSLKLYSDAAAIFNLHIPKVLVTRGEKALQIRKIKHLGIRRHFSNIYYTKTFEKKKDVFKRILKEYKVKPKESLVIGDRIEEEIKDANELKIPCVLVRRPQWPIHKGIAKPTMTVWSLYNLTRKLKT